MSQAIFTSPFTIGITPTSCIFSHKSQKLSFHFHSNNTNTTTTTTTTNNNNVRVMPCRARARFFAEPSSTSSSSSRRSLYDVLGLNHKASKVEIKAAYRTLAKLYHPDVSSSSSSSSDGTDFMEIHNAYQTLSDPTDRTLYDMSLGIGLRSTRYSSSSSSSSSVGRRWETDQCW